MAARVHPVLGRAIAIFPAAPGTRRARHRPARARREPAPRGGRSHGPHHLRVRGGGYRQDQPARRARGAARRCQAVVGCLRRAADAASAGAAPGHRALGRTSRSARCSAPTAPASALFESVLSELQRGGPTLVVIEDLHWADEATLDLVRFLGRRIDRAPCLLAISYRDDELAPAHPLRRLLGELPSSMVSRIDLPRLSAPAVELLARRALQSPAGVFAATHGNPFYVTELLRNRLDGVPRERAGPRPRPLRAAVPRRAGNREGRFGRAREEPNDG